jgi:hypothetical protein
MSVADASMEIVAEVIWMIEYIFNFSSTGSTVPSLSSEKGIERGIGDLCKGTRVVLILLSEFCVSDWILCVVGHWSVRKSNFYACSKLSLQFLFC